MSGQKPEETGSVLNTNESLPRLFQPGNVTGGRAPPTVVRGTTGASPHHRPRRGRCPGAPGGGPVGASDTVGCDATGVVAQFARRWSRIRREGTSTQNAGS